MGISLAEVQRDIEKIKLIDEYLAFIRQPDSYNIVGGLVERFEEALNAVEAARKAKWPPVKLRALKLKLFETIRFATMDNWQMRDIWRAIGVTGKGRSGRFKNDKALDSFLAVETPAKFREAIVAASPQVKTAAQGAADHFLDQMQALKAADEPARLAAKARAELEQLSQCLEAGELKRHKGWEKIVSQLPGTLQAIGALARKCEGAAKRLAAARGPARKP
jgi:hypothetical protein